MWNHNAHYHSYLLRQMPKRVGRALDVGCGLGHFAWKLAKRAGAVDAVDVDSTVLSEALVINSADNISYIKADFLSVDLPRASYDAIVSIATIHHMDMEAALEKMKLLLRPSGKLLILGLYQEKTLIDYAYSAVSIPLNFVYLRWHRASIPAPATAVQTRPAQLSLRQIRRAANAVIPGSRLQRHLFWRYSLIWQKP
jgi:ubiquinone/menaquinone biosynthesis C-methylase UbiE